MGGGWTSGCAPGGANSGNAVGRAPASPVALFASRRVRLDARFLRVPPAHLDLPSEIAGDALIAIAHETMDESPLVAAARASVETQRVLGDASPIDAEIFALWLADLVLTE